ncbi:Nif3-like dinuclear metal center hexameric protein [soil metagenome]
MDRLYDPAWAASWDAVGLVSGDPEAEVDRILFAVDPVAATAREAIECGAQLLVTHHPLFLTPVHGVAANSDKGRLVHELIRAGVALFVAHTNADSADPGVSDALAAALGLKELRPLSAAPADPLDKIVIFVPHADADRVLDALAAAGAGAIGYYSRCAWLGTGTGTFLPGQAAHPAIGAPGTVERVPETRLEMVLPRARRADVRAALLASHPYEEPAYDVLELAALPGSRGTGRIGVLPEPMPLVSFVEHVARSLPAQPAGIRAAGDLARTVREVAVCGGAGDSLLGTAAAAGVDAYVTADLRHHKVSEHLEAGGPPVLDAGHWATEWPWLGAAADLLTLALAQPVTTMVSTLVTDPWSLRAD